MLASTNLALRPFRNERLPWLATGLLLAFALILTFLHGRLVSRLVAGDEARTVTAVRMDEARIAELEAGIASEPPLKVEVAEIQRLNAYKELVDRRVFPWRLFLAQLEEALSADVRLNRISPTPRRGARGMFIDLAGVARTKDAAFSLAETLDALPAFSNAALSSLSDTDEGTEFVLEVVFDPEKAEAPLPAGGEKR
jgi:Tfp pilus assembly protein PilN